MGFEELKDFFCYGDLSRKDIDWNSVLKDYLEFMKSDAPIEQKEELEGHGEMIGMFIELRKNN